MIEELKDVFLSLALFWNVYTAHDSKVAEGYERTEEIIETDSIYFHGACIWRIFIY